jgi:opacity protein-like surface antigen
MTIISKTALAAAATVLAIAAASPAAAQDKKGAYVAAGLGIADVNNVHVDYYDEIGEIGPVEGSDTLSTRFRLKSTANLTGAIGYDFGMVRAEVEVAYSRHKLKGIEFLAINGSPVTLTQADVADFCDYEEITGCTLSGNTVSFEGGRVRQLSALGNLWVDLPVSKLIVPYVGGGAGVTGFEIEGEAKGKFAWQVGAGAAFHLSPNVALTADVRHRSVGRSTIEYDEVSGVRVGKIKTTTVGLGARLTF